MLRTSGDPRRPSRPIARLAACAAWRPRVCAAPLLVSLAGCLLAACTTQVVREPTRAHLQSDSPLRIPETIPEPVQKSVVLPRPRSSAPAETYSVVVNHVRAHDLLFALARDARLNVDIHPGISGTVSLNAIDQTLPQLLNRIARQVDMRFELDGPNLAVMPDAPFLRTYRPQPDAGEPLRLWRRRLRHSGDCEPDSGRPHARNGIDAPHR